MYQCLIILMREHQIRFELNRSMQVCIHVNEHAYKINICMWWIISYQNLKKINKDLLKTNIENVLNLRFRSIEKSFMLMMRNLHSNFVLPIKISYKSYWEILY